MIRYTQLLKRLPPAAPYLVLTAAALPAKRRFAFPFRCATIYAIREIVPSLVAKRPPDMASCHEAGFLFCCAKVVL